MNYPLQTKCTLAHEMCTHILIMKSWVQERILKDCTAFPDRVFKAVCVSQAPYRAEAYWYHNAEET